jgi:RNA polymerase sigma factor (sigma-70 family)
MANGQLTMALRHIRRMVAGTEAGGATDAELLGRFAAGRDEAAFAALVERHGPMVLGVCRRVLAAEQDAEDAFQAAFLVLARKAVSIQRRESVSRWLYEVAYRTALRARLSAARRRDRERRAETMCTPDPTAEAAWREIRPVLDEELHRLPEKYRDALVLCYLEGKSNRDAARVLGWPAGTMSRRLVRARELLRDRLAGRGVALSVGLLGAAVAQNASAAVPKALFVPTVRAAGRFAMGQAAAGVSANATALAGGVLRTMTITRCRSLAVVILAVGLAGGGAGVLLQPLSVAQPAAARGDPDAPGKAGLVDRYGDPLPAGAIVRLGTARLRHGHNVKAVVYSPDGKLIATAAHDHTIRLWDAATGKEVRVLGDPDARLNAYAQTRWLHCLAFSPDGKMLASGDHAPAWNLNTIRLWDVTTGQELRRIQGHANGVTSVAFSPDGKVLASGSVDQTIRLWDPASAKELGQLQGHTDAVHSVAFSPDGKTLASAALDGTVRLWDVPGMKEIRQFQGHQAGVEAVTFSLDGKTIASAGQDKTIRLWEVATGKETAQLTGHTEVVRCVAFTKDGRTLASGGDDQTARLWDVATGKELHQMKGNQLGIWSVAFSPDGKVVASAGIDAAVRLWDVASGKEREPGAAHRSWVGGLTFAPDGKTIFTVGRDQSIRWWEPVTGKELGHLGGGQVTSQAVAFARDGKWAVVGTWDGMVRVRELPSGKELRAWKGHEGQIWATALSPDGKILATGGREDKTVRLWDVATGNELRRLPEQPAAISVVTFAPDGKTLASICQDQAVRLWDVGTGNSVRELSEHPATVGSAAFSPDGKLLATGTKEDGMVRLWDLETGKLVRQFEKLPGYVMAVEFSPDGRSLAAGCWRTIAVWETATGKERARFLGHKGDVVGLAFAPGGRLLASGSSDTTGLLWDLARTGPTGEPTASKLTSGDADSLWTDLADGDGAKAYRAVWSLALAPGEAVPFIKERLRPSTGVDEKRVARLIQELDADDFAAREKASEELEKLGEAAAGELRKVMKGSSSAELRRRAEQLLSKFEGPEGSPPRLREVRAVEVLELIGTPEAGTVLQDLAKGAAGSRLTQEAKASLERLAR